MIGTILAERYELKEKIGDGGMSTVYCAHCHVLNRDVAVKILRSEFVDDEGFVERFDKEAKAAASIQHPNIVNVYDVGVEGAIHYIVMELVSAETLKDLISKCRGFLSNKEIVDIGLQISEALSVAHKKGIIHRDIKPQNILLSDNGKVKVADFGIARAVTSSTTVNTNEAIGSVHYASPEQSRGGFVDARTDIYSLGVLLYELATGRVPFEGDTPITVALKHLKEKPVKPSVVNEKLNPSIEALILKCLRKRASERYHSVDELIVKFRELQHKPDETLPDEIDMVPLQDDTRVLPALGDADFNLDEADSIEISGEEQSSRKLIWAGLLGVAVALIMLFAFFYNQFSALNRAESTIALPNLRDVAFAEAEQMLAEKELILKISEQRASDDVKKDYIISQSPVAGSVVKSGQDILVVVSSGPRAQKIPNVVEKDLAEARVMLSNLDLNLVISREIVSDLEVGKIISQDPVSGSELVAGSDVNVVVSLGLTPSGNVTTPNIVGLSVEDATAIIEEEQLVVGDIVREYSDSVAQDVVIRQNIYAGVQVSEGTKIGFVISQGKEEDVSEVTSETASNNQVATNKKSKEIIFAWPEGKQVVEVKVTVLITDENSGQVEERTVHHQLYRNEQYNDILPITVSGTGVIHYRIYIGDELRIDEVINFDEE